MTYGNSLALKSAPATVRVEIAWATPAEKRWILATAEGLRRQVMNMRLPTSRVLRVKDGGRIVAWAAVDTAPAPAAPSTRSHAPNRGPAA